MNNNSSTKSTNYLTYTLSKFNREYLLYKEIGMETLAKNTKEIITKIKLEILSRS